MLNLQCAYSNTVHLKRTLDTRLLDFSIDTTVNFGDLSNRFTMTTFNANNDEDNQFVIGETVFVDIYQKQAITNVSFYIESCTISVRHLLSLYYWVKIKKNEKKEKNENKQKKMKKMKT